MSTVLVFLGGFSWLMASIISFIFLTSRYEKLVERLKKSIKVDFSNKTGSKFGLSLMQATGILWVITGLMIICLGDTLLNGVDEDIVLGIIILAPIWIGALIAEKRRK